MSAEEIGADAVSAFLDKLVVAGKLSASTQNHALTRWFSIRTGLAHAIGSAEEPDPFETQKLIDELKLQIETLSALHQQDLTS